MTIHPIMGSEAIPRSKDSLPANVNGSHRRCSGQPRGQLPVPPRKQGSPKNFKKGMVLYPLIPLRPLLAEDRVLRLLPKLNNLVFYESVPKKCRQSLLHMSSYYVKWVVKAGVLHEN